MDIEKTEFGQTKDGVPKITNYGGIVTELWVPDRDGNLADVVLGFDTITDYEEKSPYFGCIVGRYGNRIAAGKFTLDGVIYDNLTINNGPNHLHGGLKGFDKQVWETADFETKNGVGVKLHYISPGMEENYPGNLDVIVTYTLTNSNELKIDYQATTDKPTVINLCCRYRCNAGPPYDDQCRQLYTGGRCQLHPHR
ncbi:MAG: aldose epimerase family protein [Planctomycetota bacterium]|jgi:aldose 1-epimerase